jgi:hypothetical protein
MFSVIAFNDNTLSRTVVADSLSEVDAQDLMLEAEQTNLDVSVFFEVVQD